MREFRVSVRHTVSHESRGVIRFLVMSVHGRSCLVCHLTCVRLRREGGLQLSACSSLYL
jgi:hypothetical protein